MDEKEMMNQAPAAPDAAEKAETPPKRQHYTRENLYAHIDLTVHQVDIIIASLVALLVISIAVGIIIR